MAILNQGSEIEDFVATGPWTYDTTTGAPRAGYGRGSMKLSAGDPNAKIQLAWSPEKTTVCATASFYMAGSTGHPWIRNNLPFFMFTSSGGHCFGLATTQTTGEIKLISYNGATYDTLATGAVPAFTAIRFDVYVENYGAGDATERCRVWVKYPLAAAPAELWIDYSGDLTTPAVTGLDGLDITPVEPTTTYQAGISEVIVAEEPTMRLGLPPIYPNAAGDTNTWDAGTYASIDELAGSATDFIESGTAAQLFLANLTTLPTGNLTPLSVKATILAAKGTSGPTKVKIAVKSGGTVAYSSDITLTDVYASYSWLMTVNPVTSAAWTEAEIAALQLGVESVT